MKKVSWKWNLVGCRKSGASRLPGTHSNMAIARYLSFQQLIRQPQAGIRRGSALLPFPLYRFSLAQFALWFIFFGPVCCCRRGPLCVSLVHFLQPRFLGYWKLEICGVHKYQALQTTDRDGGGFLKSVPSFPSPSSGLFVFPLISSGLFVSLSPSRVMVFWNFFRFDSMTI